MLKKIYSHLVDMGCCLSEIAKKLGEINKEAVKIREQMQILNKRVKEMENAPRREQAVDLRKETEKSPEKWLEEGINNILGYQAGQKRGDAE